MPEPFPESNVISLDEKRAEKNHLQQKKPTPRQIFRRRAAAATTVLLAGAAAVTGYHYLNKDNATIDTKALEILKATAIEKVVEEGKPISQTVNGGITIMDGARFRSDPNTDISDYVKFSDIEDINGVKVAGADGVTINYPTLVNGYYVDYRPLEDGIDPTRRDNAEDAGIWTKMVIKYKSIGPIRGKTEIRYVSISDQTKEAGLVNDYGNEYLPVTKDANGLVMAKTKSGEVIPEYQMNQTSAYFVNATK